MIKHKGLKALLAGLLAVGGVIAVSQSASANTYYGKDFWPGNGAGNQYCSGGIYWSSDGNAGGGCGINVDSVMSWYNDQINVLGYIKDFAADGHGPVLDTKICPGGSYLCSEYYDHLTAGNGSTMFIQHYRTNIYVNDGSTVEIRMCNGEDSFGNPLNCGSWHGPFHDY